MPKQPRVISLKNPERLGYYGTKLILQICAKHIPAEDIKIVMIDDHETIVALSTSKASEKIISDLSRYESELIAAFLSAYYSILQQGELCVPDKIYHLKAS